MKKVAIVTLSDNNNYGNRLQNYAVGKFIEKLDCEVESITNISGLSNIKFKIKNFLKYFFKLRYHNLANLNFYHLRILIKEFHFQLVLLLMSYPKVLKGYLKMN